MNELNKNEEININTIQIKKIKTIDAYSINPYNNSFIIFKSTYCDLQYLIYVTKNNFLISYDLNTNQIISEIKHSEDTKRLEYINDKKNKRDLLMAYSILNFLIIYDIKNWNKILTLNKVNHLGTLSSAILYYDIKVNESFILTSNDNYIKPDNIKVYDLKGNVRKELIKSNENTWCIKAYYDDKNNKTFIIAIIQKKYIKSYDYDNNTLYKKYNEKGVEGYSNIEIIKNKEGLVQLIISCAAYGLILIFNFNTGNLLNIIKTEEKFFTMFLYNEITLYMGTMNGNLIIMNLLTQEKKKIENAHTNYINCINKFYHIKEGNCLITQGNDNIINIYQIFKSESP